MKARLFLSFTLGAVVLFVSSSLAQGRGPGRVQGQGPVTRGGAESGARSQLRGNPQQQYRYRACLQALRQVRKRIRAMAQIVSTNIVDFEVARNIQEQLARDLQSAEQEQRSFSSSLTDEQKERYQDRLLEILKSQEDLEFLSDALGFELGQSTLESDRIKDRARELEETSRMLEKQQHDLADALEIN